MSKIKLTEEQIEQYSHADVAYLILEAKGKKETIQDLFKEVIELMKLPSDYFESKIGDFFGLLSTDKRFIMLEKGFWDLRDNHSHKIVIEEEEEDEDLSDIEVDDVPEEEDTNDEEINYDDEKIEDDEEEDDLKDLVVLDESEDENELM